MLRTGRFIESIENLIKLPEDDVLSFAAFAEWLYVGDEYVTGAISLGSHGKDVKEDDKDLMESIEPSVFGSAGDRRHMEKSVGDEGTAADINGLCFGEVAVLVQEGESQEAAGGAPEQEDDDESKSETGISFGSVVAYEHFDFSLQFSCYVLADKLQAPGFKRLMLREISFHGVFCDPENLTVDHIRYVYANTSRDDDPLRAFCIKLKCRRTRIEKTLASRDFLELMEEGGLLVKDVMEVCRKKAAKEEWHCEDEEAL